MLPVATCPAPAQEKRAPTDAAEQVGEGNAARWLEYYRRDRGQNWPQPASETKSEKARDPEPQTAPPADQNHESKQNKQ
jgi:hypothetical protein